jgi:RNA methyltransferase, TrmH family
MGVITSRANEAVKAARKLARRGARERADAFLVEGPQSAREAAPHLRQLFVTPEARKRHPDLVAAAAASGADLLEVTPAVLDSLADTRNPQGLVGVAVLPEPTLESALDGAGLVVVLIEAQDPGNVGTVIRSADAAGADAVILTVGSADPRNAKAVRASAGSLFHLPVLADTDASAVVDGARRRGLQVVATVPGAGLPHTDVDLARPTALLLGNEARGLPTELAAAADATCHVPIAGRAESLNLAATAAVVLFEAARQRTVRRSGP